MKILIELPTWLGDAIMVSPAIENLANFFNDPKITLLGSLVAVEALKNHPLISVQSGVVEGHAYHLYIIEVKNRLGLYNHLRTHNIFAQVHYIPVHLMPYYRKFGSKEGDMPFAEKYYRHCLSLPMYPTLTSNEQKYVIKIINEFYNK